MMKAISDYLISLELDLAIQGILTNLPVKITLFALYEIIWIWGLIGNVSWFTRNILSLNEIHIHSYLVST